MLDALIQSAVQVFKSLWWFFLLIPLVRVLKGIFKTNAKLRK